MRFTNSVNAMLNYTAIYDVAPHVPNEWHFVCGHDNMFWEIEKKYIFITLMQRIAHNNGMGK